jgi:acyl-CoA thioesterase II
MIPSRIDRAPRGQPSADLADIMTLEPQGEDRFLAPVQKSNHVGTIYGGGLLAQAIRAAEISAPGRLPHSVHAHFHRAGTMAAPVTFQLDRVRDGAASCARRLGAWQDGALLFEALITLVAPPSRPAFEHRQAWREAPPPPDEALAPAQLAELWADRLPPDQTALLRRAGTNSGLELRLVDPERFMAPSQPAFARIWMRTEAGRPWDSDHAGLAFLSDFLIARIGVLPHLSAWDPRGWTLSLDHAIWIHAVPPRGAWLLYEIESPWSGAGRGLSLGRIYDADGRLLANVAQEALIRTRSD